MPAINFQSKFAQAVERGEKRQTLRHRRKVPIQPGDELSLYTGQRTKACRLLRTVICTGVTPIRVYTDGRVEVNGQEVANLLIEDFAKADGFQKLEQFYQFFLPKHRVDCWEGEIITWA